MPNSGVFSVFPENLYNTIVREELGLKHSNLDPNGAGLLSTGCLLSRRRCRCQKQGRKILPWR
ncbi:hypothetical protein SBV1_3280026 [Verrucomicrobia bacterium]|nr:hypothetical protein SBV1_3280026 [Verrucomicrobiota bacterium]